MRHIEYIILYLWNTSAMVANWKRVFMEQPLES